MKAMLMAALQAAAAQIAVAVAVAVSCLAHFAVLWGLLDVPFWIALGFFGLVWSILTPALMLGRPL